MFYSNETNLLGGDETVGDCGFDSFCVLSPSCELRKLKLMHSPYLEAVALKEVETGAICLNLMPRFY